MNTNRSSYLLGAALGSALVLALCAPAMAADIYDGGLKGGYDVPPPPPSDRGIYFKGYVGEANPDVGDIWTKVSSTATSRCTTRTSSRARCSVSAWAGRLTNFDGTQVISGVFARDITSNDVMLGYRYKFQREAVVYQPVK